MRELIEKLPENVRFQIELFRKNYRIQDLWEDLNRAEIRGYVKGLQDAGMITDHERGMLCVYCCSNI